MEFVGQVKKPIVQFLLNLIGMVKVNFVAFFEKHVVGHVVGEEFIDLVVATQLLTAVKEVGGDDGFDKMSIVAVFVESDALGCELLTERVIG